MSGNHKTEIEQELAYEWVGQPQTVISLSYLKGWNRVEERCSIVDSIYDTDERDLSAHKTGVRVRSVNGTTTLTSKRFIERRSSGENIFEEQHISIHEAEHPNVITVDSGLRLPGGVTTLSQILRFNNERQIVTFSKGNCQVQLINEKVAYSNALRVVQERLLEVEFKNVDPDIISAIKTELEKLYKIRQIHEGKTDRAERLLRESASKPLIQNIKDVIPLKNVSPCDSSKWQGVI